MKRTLAVLTLLLAATVLVLAQVSTAGQDVKTAGTKTKDVAEIAGTKTKNAAETAGTKTKDAAETAASTTKKGVTKAADKVTGKIDINSASKADLMKLEGVGDVTADKIVAGRPYATKRDLLTRKIVTAGEYDKIRDKIVAHGGTTSSKSTKTGSTTPPPK